MKLEFKLIKLRGGGSLNTELVQIKEKTKKNRKKKIPTEK